MPHGQAPRAVTWVALPPALLTRKVVALLLLTRSTQYAPVEVATTFLAGVAILLIVAALFALKSRSAPTVQVITAAATGASGSSSGGATSVTANGYVVARTKASVSAKIAGRLAYLGVSEGSFVHPAPYAEQMYRQEVRGRGEGMRVVVTGGHQR